MPALGADGRGTWGALRDSAVSTVCCLRCRLPPPSGALRLLSAPGSKRCMRFEQSQTLLPGAQASIAAAAVLPGSSEQDTAPQHALLQRWPAAERRAV